MWTRQLLSLFPSPLLFPSYIVLLLAAFLFPQTLIIDQFLHINLKKKKNLTDIE